MKPEDRKRLKQHIEMIVEHKTPIEELEDMNRKLRLELNTIRFKETQNVLMDIKKESNHASGT